MNAHIPVITKISGKLLIFFLALLITTQLARAATVVGASSDFDALPPVVQSPDAKPIVMLTMSNDHQLFYKAYTDYDDLIKADGTIGEDGILETTYTDNFDYYGYFDSGKCYEYVTASGRFEPKASAAGTNNHSCDHLAPALSRWSGNFLNWLTMSRMDIVRKVLYGGKRSTDTSALTVLERAFIPSDNHAWAKYFPATDLNKYTPYNSTSYSNGMTFCNVTPRGSNEFSEDNTEAPTLRIAAGKWDLWASQESKQCLWDTEFNTAENPDGPTGTEGVAELIVRVKVCDSSLLGNENCKNYGTAGSPIYKPIGMLNKYGENGSMDFGLLTGSYEKGKSGGVLRKNISPFTDEINSDGTFSSVNGIVATLNKFRISRYSYDDPGYGDSTKDNCPYGQNSWSNGECANWGNPMGEIYLESLRYFSGAGGGRSEYSANNDTTWIPGIATNVTWRDPYGPAQSSPTGGGYKQCSKPNIIAFSTGVLGFDSDEYSGAGDVGGSLDVNTVTDEVGNGELDASKTYYIGSTSGGSPGDLCQALGISNLSNVTGLCPEAPGLQGSFKMAGLAYYAHKSTTDLRSGEAGVQNVNTYSIALAPPIPDIKVNVGGNPVRIIPVGYNRRDDNTMIIVNFEVINQTATSGEFFMNFENAPAGSDHDSDFKGYLKYEVSGNNISIVAHNTGSSAGSAMNMGYIIDGVTDPGTYWLASNRNVLVMNNPGGGSYTTTKADIDTNCGALTYPASGSMTVCTTNFVGGTNRDLRGARTHTAGTSSTELLKSPLWYAAKWGNFRDINGDDTPDLQAEWDVRDNNTGAYSPDGIPDSYFLVTNPNVLESQFEKALQDILQRVSSGTAAAVIADTVSMTGAVVQALYQPVQYIGDDTITWGGILHSIFIDDSGHLREDTNQNAALDSTDAWIKIKYNSAVGRTQVFYCNTADNCATTTAIKEVEDLKPIWNARDRLADISNAMITTQRNYSTASSNSTSGGRYIFSWFDNGDNTVDAGEVVDFTDSSITSSNYGYLNAVDETEADNIVDFIRGKEGIAGFRSRTADYDGDGTREAWRLGDVVHSTPLIVAKPSQKWDVLYGDDTYTAFRTQYENRRSVVYVGTNDGMLHAFNAGFFDANNSKFCLDAGCTGTLTSETGQPLGGELWAYVPKNLLPHLRWLTETDYPHVYYMDGKPQSFDVNIFPDDSVHPGGWGTILVAGMRLGGGPLDVDYDHDGTTDYTAKSAYVIMDITDPEQPPVLLGEFTDADLGFTTSTPEVVVRREPDANIDWTQAGSGTYPNDWYLVFGSGPTDFDTVTSSQNAQLYAFKLQLVSGHLNMSAGTQVTKIDTGISGSFIGDPAVADWSNDFKSDAIYFGIIGGTEAAPTGQLMRVAIDSNTPSTWAGASKRGALINPGQPFVNKPELYSIDAYPNNEWWIFAGTGRLFTTADNLSTSQQSMYGIREIHDSGAPAMLPDVSVSASTSTLSSYHVQNVTGVQVYTDASVSIPASLSAELVDPDATDGVFTFNEFEGLVKAEQGWYFNFEYDGTNPATRNLNKATYWQKLVLLTSYTPPADTCIPEGFSDIYAVYYQTGTAHWKDVGLNVTSTTSFNGSGYPEKLPKMELSYGIASEITLYQAKDGVHPVVQMSTGEIVTDKPITGMLDDVTGRQSWREIPLD